LFVARDTGDAALMRHLLGSAGSDAFSLQVTTQVATASRRLAKGGFDAVLLSLCLPQSQALDAFSQLRAQAPDLPIVVITDAGQEELAFAALRSGAQDFLIKGQIDSDLLMRTVRHVIERGDTDAALRHQSEMVQILQDVTVAVNEASTFEQAIRLCLDRVCALTGWPVGHVYVRDPNSPNQLVSPGIWYLQDPKRFEAFRRGSEKLQVEPGRGLTTRVLATGKPAWLADVQKSRTFKRAGLAKEVGLRSAFAFPVLEGNNVVAVLEFFTKTPAEPDEALLRAIAVLGTQLGRVTERTHAERVLEVRARQQAAVAELGQYALRGADLSDLLNRCVERIAQILKVEYCKVLELLADGDALVLRAGVGWKPGLIGQASVGARDNSSQAAFTLHSNEPVIVEDLRAETRFKGLPLPDDHGVVSGISVIIHGRERPFGVLGVHTTRRRAFTKDDVNFLQATANVLAGAIERKRAEQRLHAQHSALANLATHEAIQQGDLEAALRAITETAGRTLEIERVSIWLYDEERTRIRCIDLYERGMHRHSSGAELVAKDYPSYFKALEEDRTIAAHDAHRDPRTNEFSANYLTPLGITSMLDAPLRRAGIAVGVVCHEHVGPARQWALDEQNFAGSIADMVALAMGLSEHKRAKEALAERARRFEGLIRTSAKVTGTVEAEDTLSSIAEEAAKLLGLEGAGFRLLEGDRLVVAGRYGLAQHVMLKHALKVGESLTGLVAREGHTIAVADLREDQRLHADHKQVAFSHGIVAYLGTPLRYRDRLIGVLNVYGKEQHTFDEEEIGLLRAFADHAAIAIAKARLYGEAKRHAEELGQEVDERKQAEEALRESEEHFRNLIEGSIQGILIDRDRKPVFANQSFADMLGYESPEEILALESTDPCIAPYERARLRRYTAARLKGEEAPIQYEYDAVRKDGSIITVQNVARAINWQGAPAIQSTIIDITERKRYEEQLAYLANYDPLTDLFNRRRFEEELEEKLAHARRYARKGALLWLDLDQFKEINDSFGHRAGNELLADLAGMLREGLRETDVLARLGGDEFGILLPETDAKQTQVLAARVLEQIRQHAVVIKGERLRVTTSIGVAPFSEKTRAAEDLLAQADIAMFQAKDEGRNRVSVYKQDTDFQALLETRVTWVRRIHEGLDQDRFLLYAQPILDLSGDGQASLYELLLRLRAENGDIIAPGAFLDVAERFGLAQAIDRWVTRHTFKLLREQCRAHPDLRFEVNLSGKSLGDSELLAIIERELASGDIDPGALVWEVTETSAIADFDRANEFIRTLKGLGCQFALDDFGIGFSSFHHLKHLPVDYLKIDGSFIRNLPHDAVDQHLVQAMVQVAKGLGKQTIAEFVENEETLKLLREYDVDYAQGYHIGRPCALDEALGSKHGSG
jgi:diguanylate cyclase (GGDEF)-like protein/PAS domain S-box-containing protein